ncbi:hypothetical protein HPB50_006666 [Hyalomma asiaticum]|uniref:Uncharacterized protein n=1 Tax=Hyalomma asiaticum TaxID=266040 RepID=A0ACB7TF78_HYAAI|nr:hypothetical protein HPB50_006666 [Hyalomma asiaticum]
MATGSDSTSCEAGPGKLIHSNSRDGRKMKNRRRKAKKRKWKPYHKLSWEERLKVDERGTRRANRLRQQMFARGRPVAPYNTTQFIMEDHCVQEPDYESTSGRYQHGEYSMNNTDTSDEYYSSPEDVEIFLRRHFSVDCEDYHDDRLNSMAKPELVHEYMLLEERVEELERQLEVARAARAQTGTGDAVEGRLLATDTEEQTLQKMAVFRDEIRKLAEKNGALRESNRQLHEALNANTAEP